MLLRAAGFELVSEPESFLVDKATHLLPDEEERAQAWGADFAKRAGKGKSALLPTVTLVDSLHSRETIRSDG